MSFIIDVLITKKWYFVIVVLSLYLQEEVIINYVKLHADPKEGKSLDIGKFFLYKPLIEI